MIWLHFSPELRAAGIGSEVGEDKNNVWLCTEGGTFLLCSLLRTFEFLSNAWIIWAAKCGRFIAQ